MLLYTNNYRQVFEGMNQHSQREARFLQNGIRFGNFCQRAAKDVEAAMYVI